MDLKLLILFSLIFVDEANSREWPAKIGQSAQMVSPSEDDLDNQKCWDGMDAYLPDEEHPGSKKNYTSADEAYKKEMETLCEYFKKCADQCEGTTWEDIDTLTRELIKLLFPLYQKDLPKSECKTDVSDSSGRAPRASTLMVTAAVVLYTLTKS